MRKILVMRFKASDHFQALTHVKIEIPFAFARGLAI